MAKNKNATKHTIRNDDGDDVVWHTSQKPVTLPKLKCLETPLDDTPRVKTAGDLNREQKEREGLIGFNEAATADRARYHGPTGRFVKHQRVTGTGTIRIAPTGPGSPIGSRRRVKVAASAPSSG